jgi:hypothetical protein
MKKIALFIYALAIGACQNDGEPVKTYQIKYEVLTSRGKWRGEYITEAGEKVCICTASQLESTGWTYRFNVTKRPFILHIDATTSEASFGTPEAPDVSTHIYVDNKLVSANTNNWAKGVTSSDYTIQ